MTRRIYRLLLLVTALYWLGIFVATHLPPARMVHVEVSDKVEHFCAYLGLTILLDIAIGRRLRFRGDWLTILIVLAYGAVDEWLQTFVGRSCSLEDWFADGAGAAAGVCLCGLARWAYGFTFGRISDQPQQPADAEAETVQR